MKLKRITLISLILLILLASLGAISASDIGEINVNEGVAIDDTIAEIDVNDEINPDTIKNQDDGMDLDWANDENQEMDLDIVDNGNDDERDIADIAENVKDDKANLEAAKLQSTITVDGSAYNQMLETTIQDAIDRAKPGDTILITGTAYIHCHFIVNKTLTIISNVGTTMSTCPSNTQGSGSRGIFYISPEASGTVIKGFVLTNIANDAKAYGILVRGASNVKIENCTINTTQYADGIRLENATNTLINNSIIRNSKIGITILNSTKTTITNNNISNNSVTGVFIGENNTNTTIHTNNITYNRNTGINMSSANYVYILNNLIAYNRNGDDFTSTAGAGVYVNCNITKIEIRGNLIRQNGLYGVLNDYRTRNMNSSLYAELLEINTNNYYMGHTERLAYHIEYKPRANGAFIYNSALDIYEYVGQGNGNYDVDKSVVYLAEAFNIGDMICGATLYKAPNIVWSEGNHLLEISEIRQDKKGVYSVSIVDANGNIIKDVSSIYVTFYLNKNNTNATPLSGDIYKTVLMKNGTATVDFTKETFKESGNVIIACFPGLYNQYKNNPYATFNVADDDIPGTYRQTQISLSNMKLVPSSGQNFTAILRDENGNPVSGETVSFKISGISKTYTRTTDSEGKAQLTINLAGEKTYTVTVSYAGSENYNKSSAKATLTIKKQTPKISSSNLNLIPKSGEYFTVTLKDENGNAIANKQISFTVASKTYTRTTDSQGKAKLQINLAGEKTYTIVTKSAATSQYNAASKSNTITIKAGSKKVKLNVPNAKFVPQSGEYYTVTIMDENNKPLADKNLVLSIGGKDYSRISDSAGEAKLKINLANFKSYPITVNFSGDDIYSPASSTGNITISKGTTKITAFDRTFSINSGETFAATLIGPDGSGLANKLINFIIDSQNYAISTDSEGVAKLEINLNEAKTYSIISQFAGDNQYNAVNKSNTISIRDEDKISYIDPNLPNDEIQRIIDESPEAYISKFLGENYEGINLIINKSQGITSDINTVLNGKDGSAVFTINSNDVNVSNLIINANSSSADGNGIIINNSNGVNLENNIIKNILDSAKIDDYNNGSTILPGYGISILNSSQINIVSNKISSFESGIYAEYSKELEMAENEITLNDYGIKYGFGNSNTAIEKNVIKVNIGWYIMNVPEGPRGYGIFLNNSAVNISIDQNNISNNYMGISIDANNSTGIVVTSNLIADNALEGIRFNAGYDLAQDAVEPIITDNAIYRNAKGPSMMILGEMSANPEGIYGPGQWDEELRLKIDPNWYGVNVLRTWDYESGIVGIGTMCPRIKTTTIQFPEIVCTEKGTYTISFYKDGVLDTNLASFDIYATLNRNSDKQIEAHFLVENGTGTFSFNPENYLESGNVIEISDGTLINVVDRLFTVIYTHNVDESEIPSN